MQLTVTDAIWRAGAPVPYRFEQTIEDHAYGERELKFLSPLTVTGELVFDGTAFSVSGEAHTTLRSVCARCAKVFDESYAFSYRERFVRPTDFTDEDDCYVAAGDALELEQAVMDNFYLELPLVSLCRPDCRGLCPVCGCNRNDTECTCEQSRPKNAFSALESFTIVDKEE